MSPAKKAPAKPPAAAKKAPAKPPAASKTSPAKPPASAKQPAAKASAPPAGGPLLAKSEPDVYSIDDLARDGKTGWEGVRNYQARNTLRAAKVGDAVLFYHSNAEPSGVVGVGKVARTAYPDPTQFDPKSDYFDGESDPADPRWSTIDVAFVEKFRRVVTLAELKADPALAGLETARKGSRLSVHPVSDAHFARIVALGRKAR